MDSPKYIEYHGIKFCRDDKTGYYLCSTIRKRLHRYVWETEVGAIPKGYHIHHIDGNKANNDISNLALITASGHERLHGQEQERKEKCRQNVKKATVKAVEWHKSEEGRKWHSQMKKGTTFKKYPRKCLQCGNEFQGTIRSKFCSNNCKSKYRRDIGADNVIRICQCCGKEFSVNRYAKNIYCSKECSIKMHIGWSERKKGL